MNGGRQTIETYVIDPNGVKRITRTTQESSRQHAFWSGGIGVSGTYQVSNRLAIDLQLTKLLTANKVMSLNTTIKPYGEPTAYSATVTGRATVLNLTFGMSYHFGRKIHYNLVKQQE